MIDYDKFRQSLTNLQVQFENYKNIDNTLPLITQEAIAESTIQRFEICYDCMWKVLKRYLIDGLGLAEVPNSPKPILKLANENKLFASDLAKWLEYAEARVATAHDYCGEKAQTALELMEGFIDDAIGLYQTMSGESWMDS